MRKLLLLLIVITLLSCKVKSDLPDPLEAGWKGEKVCEVIQDNEELRVLKCTFAPGVGHERHFHLPHFGYTIKGSTFKITDAKGTRTLDVQSGTSFSKDQISEHEVENVGDSIAVFLIVEYK